MLRSARNLAIAVSSLWLCGHCFAADSNAESPASRALFEYMVQSVCLDGRGAVLSLSPLDSRCASIRKLHIGEKLPYHKDDWPSVRDFRQMPRGRQRGDSFPLAHLKFGVVAFHTFDWGDGVRRFGVYDGVNGDGGSLVGIGNGLIGSIMTVDHAGGVQLFVNGQSCRVNVDAESLLPGWPFSASDLNASPSGILYSRIKRVKTTGDPCPVRYAHAITKWYFTAFTPMAAPGRLGNRTIRALVTEHYSGKDLQASPNMERMYFSRELGRMRWERWQNLSLNERADDTERAETIDQDERCIAGAGKPPNEGDWVMVACHEWTNMVPPTDPRGDSVAPWLNALVSAAGTSPLLDVTEK